MGKEYVPIFFDWLETTQDLNAEEKGNLIDAVVSYASGKEYEHLLTGGCTIAFRFLKGQVDRNAKISEVRARARQNKPDQNESNDNKPDQNGTKQVETAEKLPEVKGFMDESEARAIQGEHDRILDAAKDAGFKCTNTENAALIQLYAQHGLQKMLDGFTSCAEHSAPTLAYLRAVLKGEPRKKTGKVLPAQNFQQRDYSKVEEQLMKQQTEELIQRYKDIGVWDEEKGCVDDEKLKAYEEQERAQEQLKAESDKIAREMEKAEKERRRKEAEKKEKAFRVCANCIEAKDCAKKKFYENSTGCSSFRTL